MWYVNTKQIKKTEKIATKRKQKTFGWNDFNWCNLTLTLIRVNCVCALWVICRQNLLNKWRYLLFNDDVRRKLPFTFLITCTSFFQKQQVKFGFYRQLITFQRFLFLFSLALFIQFKNFAVDQINFQSIERVMLVNDKVSIKIKLDSKVLVFSQQIFQYCSEELNFTMEKTLCTYVRVRSQAFERQKRK